MASRLTVLKSRQGEIITEQKTLTAKLEQADLKAEDRAKVITDSKALQAEFATVTDEIETIQRALDQERAAAGGRGAEHEQPHISVRDRREDDPKRGFRHIADFARSVKAVFSPNGQFDPRLASLGMPRMAAPSNYMQETGGSSGEGFLVPPEFRADIYQIVFDDEGILAAMNPEPTDSNTVEFNADETTPWGSTGVQAAWRAEVAQLTANKAVTKPRLNKLHELYALVTADQELLDDAPRLIDRLTNKAGLAIRWKLEDALVNGDGVGKPLGFAASQNASRVTVSKDSGQAANTVSVANLANMYSQLLAEGGSPFWLIHRTCAAQIFGLSIGNQPAVLPNNQPATGLPSGLFLWGFPIKWSEHAATLSSLGDVQLVNPAGYICNVKSGAESGMKFDMSIHLYFDYNMTAFRWIFRAGGQPLLSAAVSPAKGSTNRSHSLVLQNR